MTKLGMVGAWAALGIAGAMLAAAADAAEVKVISTGSFKAAFAELGPAFEKSSGHKATAIWAGLHGTALLASGRLIPVGGPRDEGRAEAEGTAIARLLIERFSEPKRPSRRRGYRSVLTRKLSLPIGPVPRLRRWSSHSPRGIFIGAE